MGGFKVPGSLGCSDHETVEFRRREECKKQEHNFGFQDSSLQFLQRRAWKNPKRYGPEEERDPEEQLDTERSHPTSSRKVHTDK